LLYNITYIGEILSFFYTFSQSFCFIFLAMALINTSFGSFSGTFVLSVFFGTNWLY
jgi:hypothetical protein